MAIIRKAEQSAKSDDSEYKGPFRVHSNYLTSFRMILASCYGGGRSLYTARLPEILENLSLEIRSSRPYSRISRNTDVDLAGIRSSLEIAWSTERILTLPHELGDEELIPVANNWAVVQAYYVFYHATRALSLARGQPRPRGHSATKKTFSDVWTRIGLLPWAFGDGAHGCENAPESIEIDLTLNPWPGCDDLNFWSIAYKALSSTRQDILKEQIDEGRKKKQRERQKAWELEEDTRLSKGARKRKKPRFARPLLTPTEKQETSNRIGTITLMDYMWRLRIRSNYEDSQMFAEGPEYPVDSILVYRNVRELTAATMLASEILVLKHIGRSQFSGMVDRWLKRSNIRDRANGLPQRLPFLLPIESTSTH
jgi:hypothetical protein